MNEVVLIVGSRGSGKSTKAREEVAKERRVIVLDPSGDWSRRGWQSARTLLNLNEQVARKWKKGFRLCYTPPVGQEPLALHAISEMLFWYQDRHYHASREEVVLVVDEMAESYSHAVAASAKFPAFRRVLLQGRHYGIGVLAITQRPHDVATRVRDCATRQYIFQLHDHNARDAILKVIGPQWRSALMGLRKVDFANSGYLSYVGGDVSRGVLSFKTGRSTRA